MDRERAALSRARGRYQGRNRRVRPYRAGEEAPAVADLFDGYREGPLSGMLAEGTLTATRVHGTTMARLLRALRQDDAYVTVHTRTHPDGEIRGQLRAQPTVAHR